MRASSLSLSLSSSEMFGRIAGRASGSASATGPLLRDVGGLPGDRGAQLSLLRRAALRRAARLAVRDARCDNLDLLPGCATGSAHTIAPGSGVTIDNHHVEGTRGEPVPSGDTSLTRRRLLVLAAASAAAAALWPGAL